MRMRPVISVAVVGPPRIATGTWDGRRDGDGSRTQSGRSAPLRKHRRDQCLRAFIVPHLGGSCYGDRLPYVLVCR